MKLTFGPLINQLQASYPTKHNGFQISNDSIRLGTRATNLRARGMTRNSNNFFNNNGTRVVLRIIRTGDNWTKSLPNTGNSNCFIVGCFYVRIDDFPAWWNVANVYYSSEERWVSLIRRREQATYKIGTGTLPAAHEWDAHPREDLSMSKAVQINDLLSNSCPPLKCTLSMYVWYVCGRIILPTQTRTCVQTHDRPFMGDFRSKKHSHDSKFSPSSSLQRSHWNLNNLWNRFGLLFFGSYKSVWKARCDTHQETALIHVEA